jgi:LAO/AO transport system kinase
MSAPPIDVDAYVAGVLAGDRRAVARAITLVESRRSADAGPGSEILERLAPRVGKSVRVGITGAPGVGKSTLIETLGLHLVERGHSLAVLAIDPTSPLSGGSLLGDKTRMVRLSQHPRAFVRPSPSRGVAGGVAPRTREALYVCEAAGFDVVIVETVGVGQSEIEVESMVDFFAVLLQPGGGDELQGLKKGVLELADALVVTKADGDLETAARAARSEYAAALGLLRPRSPHWSPPVLAVSARSGEGIAEFWETVLRQRGVLEESGELVARRRSQARAWLWGLLREGLEQAFRRDPTVAALLPDLERKVETLEATPPRAARELLAAFS